MHKKIILLLFLIIGVFTLYYLNYEEPEKVSDEYSPVIEADNFVLPVTNWYFTLVPHTVYTYESETDEGLEKIEVEVTDEVKEIMGVKTVVVRDKVWLDGELVEDTMDWYAQDIEGNVWYFGEETKEFDEDKISTHGSWEAGVDGAMPGIIMKANPSVGESYHQEYYKGEAEDMGEVIALGKKVELVNSKFDDCLQTRDYSLLDSSNEYKYYCSEVGFVVLEEPVAGGSRVELINVVAE